mmetsp:Transcript_13408/g.43426  ORF Transcript_13408/g.43426 Transcript_13408/m.43426 type:complete len:377 (+) Transcript_13408:178-1308(+)
MGSPPCSIGLVRPNNRNRCSHCWWNRECSGRLPNGRQRLALNQVAQRSQLLSTDVPFANDPALRQNVLNVPRRLRYRSGKSSRRALQMDARTRLHPVLSYASRRCGADGLALRDRGDGGRAAMEVRAAPGCSALACGAVPSTARNVATCRSRRSPCLHPQAPQARRARSARSTRSTRFTRETIVNGSIGEPAVQVSAAAPRSGGVSRLPRRRTASAAARRQPQEAVARRPAGRPLREAARVGATAARARAAGGQHGDIRRMLLPCSKALAISGLIRSLTYGTGAVVGVQILFALRRRTFLHADLYMQSGVRLLALLVQRQLTLKAVWMKEIPGQPHTGLVLVRPLHFSVEEGELQVVPRHVRIYQMCFMPDRLERA